MSLPPIHYHRRFSYLQSFLHTLWNDFAGKQVHYNTQVIPFASGIYICEIADPGNVWILLIKLLLQMIVIFAIFFVTINTERFIRGHTWQLKSFHQTVHPTDIEVTAIITLKNIGNFVSTKTSAAISINL